jgi:hypothetical protein
MSSSAARDTILSSLKALFELQALHYQHDMQSAYMPTVPYMVLAMGYMECSGRGV